MTENPPKVPTTEFPASEGWPDYPGFGSDEDVLARMNLLDWIREQLAAGHVRVEPGNHILATDGRILGFGPDSDELFRRVTEAEPALLNARIVQYTLPPLGY